MFIPILSWMTIIRLLSVNSVTFATDNEFQPCGSDEHLHYDLLQDPEMQARMDAIEEHWRHNPNHDGHQLSFHRRLQSLPSPIIIPINFLITRSPQDPYIGYEQIISQIRVLNEDFQGSNSDIGQNGRGSPSEFATLAGDFNIRFSLNKIKRKDTTLPGFVWDSNEMKNESFGGQNNEDPEHALNFWVNSFLPGTSVLGFATLPGGSWDIDGICQVPNIIGSIDYDRNNQWSLLNNYNIGRVASHEIGHWLNLRHIWGDGACTKDDQVSDTPVDDGPNYRCAADGTNSCGSNDMYMNHMDYSYDWCRNMFTEGQVDRGNDLFLPGGFREKLLDYVSNPTDTQFVDYFYFVHGDGAQCDDGHTRRDINLNQGGGSYIYLCISYSNNPFVDVITDIYVISIGSCDTGYEKIDTDLNEGDVGNSAYVCYKKESQEAIDRFITGLDVFVFESEHYQSIYGGYTLEPVDLNSKESGDYIYLGFKINFGSNYFKGPSPVYYSDASAYCQTQGTTLASIGSESDWNDARSVTGSDACWIGLRDDLNGNDDMIWSWDDNLDVTKSYGFNTDQMATTGQGPWNSGEPNEASGKRHEDCVQMLANTGKYNDAQCDDRNSHYPLCNKAPVQREYFRGPTKSNYAAASRYCRSQGAILATIKTQSEWEEANAICESNWCWIGLQDDVNGDDNMIWTWEDGSRVSNSYGFNADNTATVGQGPWANGEPNDYLNWNEDCVHMHDNGKYNDRPCSSTRPYSLCMHVIDVTESSIAFFAKSVDGEISNPDNKGDWMENNRYYEKYKDNYQNNDMYTLVICGLMIINIICLSIYCMDNNKCKWNKKKKGYKAVKYESEDTEV